MPTKREPSFVIIAPKGEQYSSMSDQEFDNYSDSSTGYEGGIIDLTLQQYAAWAITVDTLVASYTRPEPDPINISFTCRRYKRAEIGGFTEEILDFPNMAPGHLSAEYPFTSSFWARDSDLPPLGSGGEYFYGQVLRVGIIGIKPFYHKDKFYLWWDSGGEDATMTPTKLRRNYGNSVVEYNLGG